MKPSEAVSTVAGDLRIARKEVSDGERDAVRNRYIGRGGDATAHRLRR